MVQRLQGYAGADATLGSLPEAVRAELGVELAIVAREFLALQQVRAPFRTGELQGALGIQLLLDQLRVRIGLLQKHDLTTLVGRILEFGRSARVVLAKRRAAASAGLPTAQVRARAANLAEYYSKRIGAIEPKPFVLVSDPEIDQLVTDHLSDFWEHVLARAGFTAGAAA